MNVGVFFCNQIPISDLTEVNWLIQNPIRDQELEDELGEEVWMVEYDTAHPDMQYHNRYYTCIRCGFVEATFEDEALLGDRCAIFPHLATKSLAETCQEAHAF